MTTRFEIVQSRNIKTVNILDFEHEDSCELIPTHTLVHAQTQTHRHTDTHTLSLFSTTPISALTTSTTRVLVYRFHCWTRKKLQLKTKINYQGIYNVFQISG
jgi:hypothetical protein